MPRQTVFLVLVLLLFACAPADAGMPFFKRQNKAKGGMFPEEGDVPDLVRTGKVLTYKGEDFQSLYGTAGNRYIQYGLLSMTSADYAYGAPNRRVSIEIATMENPSAAAGLFYYHKGKVVGTNGETVKVGAEGVIDVSRGKRNLYFYRSNLFVKIVYSGKAPVPSLLPVAEYVDSHMPTGRDEKPEGFEFINIEGINKDTIELTPGFAFNLSFLPPAVWASAPGGGSPASDLFVITRRSNSEASSIFKDYLSYLKLHAEYIEEYNRGKQRYVKAVDPNQGRVLFTAYQNVVVIAARPDGYDKGEVLIDRVIEKIDGPAEEGGKTKRRGLFGRKSKDKDTNQDQEEDQDQDE